MKIANLHNLQTWIARNKRQFPSRLKTLEEGLYYTFFLTAADNVIYSRSVNLCMPWPLVAQDLNTALNDLKKIAVTVYGNTCTLAA